MRSRFVAPLGTNEDNPQHCMQHALRVVRGSARIEPGSGSVEQFRCFRAKSVPLEGCVNLLGMRAGSAAIQLLGYATKQRLQRLSSATRPLLSVNITTAVDHLPTLVVHLAN